MRHSRSIYRPTYDALSTDDQLLQFRLQVRPNLIFYEAFYHFPTIFKSPMFSTFANSHRHFATPFSLRSTRHHLCFDPKITFFQRLVVEILNLASAYCLFKSSRITMRYLSHFLFNSHGFASDSYSFFVLFLAATVASISDDIFKSRPHRNLSDIQQRI